MTTILMNATAIGLKAPTDAPTFTGTVTLPSTTNLGPYGNLEAFIFTRSPKASPTFTGTVTLPSTTTYSGTNLGTTLAGKADLAGCQFSGTVDLGNQLLKNINKVECYSCQLGVQNGVDGGTGRGIYFWHTGDANWTAYMSQSGTGKNSAGGTAPAGGFFTGHAIRHRIYNASLQRGFVWENASNVCIFSVREDGVGFFSNAVYAHNGYGGSHTWLNSDDRLKFEETAVSDGLATIRQLRPMRYLKSDTLNERSNLRTEVGLIAQEVFEIPQLKHCVLEKMPLPDNPIVEPGDEGPEVTHAPFANPTSINEASGQLELVYTDIFNYTIQAVKELDAIVQAQAATIAALQSEVQALKSVNFLV